MAMMAAGLTALADFVQPGSIGIAIGRPNDPGPSQVAWVFPKSPAAGAGVKTHWFIISVDGIKVVSAPSGRCITLMPGAVDTLVALELADPTRLQTNRFTIKRANVNLPADLFRGIFGPGAGTNAPERAMPKVDLIAQ